MFTLAGVAFSVEPQGALRTDEKATLRALSEPTPEGPGRPSPFRVVVEDDAPPPGLEAKAEPARVSWEAGRCRLQHDLFTADVDPLAGEAHLRRREDAAVGLITTLRIALCGSLPLRGGLVLHAAGLERGGSGLVFFGRSGIGKSTLATRSPWPMLSDELVAVLPPLCPGEPSRICGTPFRKPGPGPRPSLETPGLRALVELAQGPRFDLERLDARLALRRLMSSAAVPAGPPLWSAALSVMGRLAHEVPCYRMAWSLDEAPFDGLAEALRL